jgi:hypothetical protein
MSRSYRHLAAIAVLLALSSVRIVAQERLILFDTYLDSDGKVVGPGEIRDVEIAQGGRSWSVVRSVLIPAHYGGPAVALADGSRVLWLAILGGFFGPPPRSVLAQYDLGTGRASFIDVGEFESGATVLADRTTTRAFVVEDHKLTVILPSLQTRSITLPGAARKVTAFMADRQIILQRCCTNDAGAREIITIDPETLRIVRSIPLDRDPGSLTFSRDGERMYRRYCARHGNGCEEQRLDLISLHTGELLARLDVTHASLGHLFEVYDDRGVIIHDQIGSAAIVVRDARTLKLRGELAPAALADRIGYGVTETPTERALLVFSQQPFRYRSDIRPCNAPGGAPRFDIFDGKTLEHLNRIDLQGRCPSVVPIPPHR